MLHDKEENKPKDLMRALAAASGDVDIASAAKGMDKYDFLDELFKGDFSDYQDFGKWMAFTQMLKALESSNFHLEVRTDEATYDNLRKTIFGFVDRIYMYSNGTEGGADGPSELDYLVKAVNNGPGNAARN